MAPPTLPLALGQVGVSCLEWTLSAIVLYVLLRVASLTLSQALFAEHLGWLATAGEQLQPLDWLALLLPVALLGRELCQFRSSGTGRLIYLLSLSGAYGLLLWSVHESEGQFAVAPPSLRTDEERRLARGRRHRRRLAIGLEEDLQSFARHGLGEVDGRLELRHDRPP